jgi:peptide-methionine (R)-S-oxide reductase
MTDEDRKASRRDFLALALAGGASLALSTRAMTESSATKPNHSGKVTIENFAADGKSAGKVDVDRVVKSDEEWRKQLSQAAYQVTRRDGTERAFSGEYASNHDGGLYRCICCDTALFDSHTKFESGTGWPSFWQPISRLNVAESSDYTLGVPRTAVSCRRCDAHLGHVFDDGPKPTGLRYCMNSVALHFVARA